MKRKFGITGKILCVALVLLIAVEATSLTIAGAVEGIISSLSSAASKNEPVIPDSDNGQWEIPEAQENPNTVDMKINNGIVYNDYVYKKLGEWGYLGSYQRATDPYTGYWLDYVASVGPVEPFSLYEWTNDVNGTWINNSYITTAVKRPNGEYGIHKHSVVPGLTFGGFNNLDTGYILSEDVKKMIGASGANPDQAYMRVSAWGGKSASISYYVGDYTRTQIYNFTPNAEGTITADTNLAAFYETYRGVPTVGFSVNGNTDAMGGFNVAFIDNTSPSIHNVDIYQQGEQIVVRLKTNEGVRWAADSVKEDLDDIWVEVDLQVIGTDYTQTVRAHIAGIRYNYHFSINGGTYANEIVFMGDLGPFADLDYKVLDISNVSMPKDDYPITFGKMLMCANQLKDTRVRNETLRKWDSEKEVTVYETYNTSAICDLAGNPINLETVVNWPINQKEIKNDATFVRKIEFMNDKILLGTDMKNADGFLDSVTRADYFFGPDDVIAPRLSLNRILTDEEVKTFRVKTNIKDASGEYIWLDSKSTGNYYIGQEEFMYIDFEAITLSQSMSADAQDGSKSYFEVTAVECELSESPPFTYNLPSSEKTLYIDLWAPQVTVKSNSLVEPDSKDGYFKLDIEVDIVDTEVDGMLQSGMLEQRAYFYLSGNVNEETPIRFVVNKNAAAPDKPEGYTGSASLVPGGKIKLGNGSIGMANTTNNKAYVHLLIPEKSNLFVQGFTLYADVTDMVGNRVDIDRGYDVEYKIDRQIPEINVSSISTVFGSSDATNTVKVEATDGNKVESVSYQWVEAGEAYDNSAWESAIIDTSSKVTATITKRFDGTNDTAYDMTRRLISFSLLSANAKKDAD